MSSWIPTCVRFGLGMGVLFAAMAAPQGASAQRLSLAEINEKIVCISSASGPDLVIFDGCNIQIVDGTGTTGGTPPHNGKGNLILGYNEDLIAPTGKDRTGAHNLVVGPEHTFSSYGGLVAGKQNTISAKHASVSGGRYNIAGGHYSTVSGGIFNTASSTYASVSGGRNNTASGNYASVSGGRNNTASGGWSSASGGGGNTASGFGASVSGGYVNTTIGTYASVSGGRNNVAGGTYSTVSGGNGNTTYATDDHTPP